MCGCVDVWICGYVYKHLFLPPLFSLVPLPFSPQIILGEKELVPGPWRQPNVEMRASALLPVPLPLGGVLVVGEETISYLNGGTSTSFPKVFFFFSPFLLFPSFPTSFFRQSVAPQ